VYVVDASVGAGELARLYVEACVARSGVSGRRRQASAARSVQSILDAQVQGGYADATARVSLRANSSVFPNAKTLGSGIRSG